MCDLTADACARLGIFDVPPTPDARSLDEIPELADAKLPVAPSPIAPDNAA